MELIREELKSYTPSGERTSGFSESTDIIIPDSFPDFDEVVFSSATINVKDELKQPGRILISGQMDAVIVYRCFSQNGFYRINVPLNFAHVEDLKGVHENALHFIKYDISQVDVRILNSRKISVTCSCVMHPQFFEPSYCSLTCDIQDAPSSLCIQKSKQTVRMISASERQRFVILDDLEIQQKDDQTPLHTEVRFEHVDCTVSNGRITLNGSAILGIWEKHEDSQIIYHRHTIPFHQILESDTLCDNTPTRILLSCHSVICHYANSEILSVNINTEALFLQETEQEISCIKDLYDLNQQADPAFHPVSLCTITENETFSYSASETLAVANNVSDVLSTELTVCSIMPAESNEIKCIISYSILYLDDTDENKIHHLQKQQPIVLQRSNTERAGTISNLVCTAETSFQDKQITLRIKGSGISTKYLPLSLPNLEEVSFSSFLNKEPQPIRVLFIDEPVSLWQIAKSNRSTTHLIKQCNGLPEDITEVSHTKLLIP